MTVTIYHNPKCGTSRKVLGMIQDAGHSPAIIEYLKTPLDRDTLAALVKHLNMPVRAIMRSTEAVYQEQKLDNPALDDGALITAIIENPILLQRPIVVTKRGAKLCRPVEAVTEIL